MMTKRFARITQVELGPDDSSDGQGSLDIPPSIKLKFSQLKVVVVRAENLPRLDGEGFGSGSGINPYFVASIGSLTLQSKVSDGVNAYWNQEILMPVVSPSYLRSVKLQVFDKNLIQKDEAVGSINFDLQAVRAGKYRGLGWRHIYGASLKAPSDQKQLMATFPDKGRLRSGSQFLSW